MASPFLPADVIADEFQTLQLRPTTRGLHSICSTWSASGSAPPPAGRLLPGQSSVSRCGPSYGQLNLYKLIQLLYAEAALVQLNVRAPVV